MGFIRFSLAGHEALVVPDRELLINRRLPELGGLMLRHSGEASILEPGMMEDITPPSFVRNRYRYFLTTPPEEPLEKVTIHFLPKDLSRQVVIASPRKLPEGVERQITLPDDSAAFPLLRPTLDASQLEIHELILPTFHLDPQAVIESVRG
jgi:hypothetical protein